MPYQKICSHFAEIYGHEVGPEHSKALVSILEGFQRPQETPTASLTAQDAILITYGDAIQSKGVAPLKALQTFMEGRVGKAINTIHLLPFFPYSSDDGFSVIDYAQVDPALGNWDDIAGLGDGYDLMFDAVINHISVRSAWFQAFLDGRTPYTDYFITILGDPDLGAVFRPRALPLLTQFESNQGRVSVWTTFSEDQVDLNYHNPEVLLDILRILLMFVERGARFIRLDAIAYIWKEIGTSCLHLEKAHQIIQLFHLVFAEIAPYVQIITETNVPHAENISYFGDGTNEAQLVYNFSLPPLVLHAMHHQDATTLSRWAKTLSLPSNQTSFFNFLASHDGVGVMPAKGLIPDEDIMAMCRRVEQLGGFVSYKNNADGSRSPYELNINYLDALGDPEEPDESEKVVADRFLASQSIMLALKGVPGIYYHSLLGSRSWHEGVRQTGRNRTINREKLLLKELLADLDQEGSLRQLVFSGYCEMLQKRGYEAGEVFNPTGLQVVLDLTPELFVVLRGSPDGKHQALCFTNVTETTVEVALNSIDTPDLAPKPEAWTIILGRNAAFTDATLTVGPYGVAWLTPEE